jgi:hypothetical protein
VVAVAYFWRRVPETKGLWLEEIGAQVEGRHLAPGAVQARS